MVSISCQNHCDTLCRIALTVRLVMGRDSFSIMGLTLSYQLIFISTDQNIRSNIHKLSPFSLVAHCDTELIKKECFFLQSTTISDNQSTTLQHPHHLHISHRVNNVNV